MDLVQGGGEVEELEKLVLLDVVDAAVLGENLEEGVDVPVLELEPVPEEEILQYLGGESVPELLLDIRDEPAPVPLNVPDHEIAQVNNLLDVPGDEVLERSGFCNKYRAVSPKHPVNR